MLVHITTISKRVVSLLILTLFFSFTMVNAQGDAAAGEKLFNANCKSCHKPTDKKSTGPGLAGVLSRWGGDKAKLKSWINNPDGMKKSGDAYATKLDAEFAASNMSAFPAVTEADVDNLLAYIEVAGAAKADAAPATGATTSKEGGAKQEDSGTFVYIAFGALILLAILIGVLSSIAKTLETSAREQQGLPAVVEEHLTLGQKFSKWKSNNPYIFALAVTGLILWALVTGWYTLKDIGVYTGYAPEQPIKFSHKLHAGDRKIPCQYCHTGVEKSKHAIIPSVNVCMNCHVQVQQGPKYGETEIAKIYAAAGYNPKTAQYDKPSKPLEWIRVYSLPDHVYFNHSQHVSVGKIECNECHGDKVKDLKVENMEVLTQATPITMGWCIDCHRKTQVQVADNDYYTQLHEEFKKDMKKGEKFTVEKIGGLECAKCHY